MLWTCIIYVAHAWYCVVLVVRVLIFNVYNFFFFFFFCKRTEFSKGVTVMYSRLPKCTAGNLNLVIKWLHLFWQSLGWKKWLKPVIDSAFTLLCTISSILQWWWRETGMTTLTCGWWLHSIQTVTPVRQKLSTCSCKWLCLWSSCDVSVLFWLMVVNKLGWISLGLYADHCQCCGNDPPRGCYLYNVLCFHGVMQTVIGWQSAMLRLSTSSSSSVACLSVGRMEDSIQTKLVFKPCSRSVNKASHQPSSHTWSQNSRVVSANVWIYST